MQSSTSHLMQSPTSHLMQPQTFHLRFSKCWPLMQSPTSHLIQSPTSYLRFSKCWPLMQSPTSYLRFSKCWPLMQSPTSYLRFSKCWPLMQQFGQDCHNEMRNLSSKCRCRSRIADKQGKSFEEGLKPALSTPCFSNDFSLCFVSSYSFVSFNPVKISRAIATQSNCKHATDYYYIITHKT